MTILSTFDASRVRNLALSALHQVAADCRCEVSDIIALLPPPSISKPEGRAVKAEELAQSNAAVAGEAGEPTKAEASPAPILSQPGTSSSHARAAQTGGEGYASQVTSPPVEPDAPAAASAGEQACRENVDEGAPPPRRVDVVVGGSLPGAEGAADLAFIPPFLAVREGA